MSEQINNSYPMISEKNWWILRDKFKASLPATVTPNYIKTLLTMSGDSSAKSNVIVPMKRIGLLDDDNKPTALANEWRLDDKYKSACDKIIRTVYPTELLDLFPESDIDRSVAENWFMSQGVGQGAAGKMAALFILLKSGIIKDKKSITSKQTNGAKKSTSTTGKSKNFKKENIATETVLNPVNIQSSVNQPNLHIDLQIHISPESTPEQIETIFASMAKHLYGAYNK